MTHRTSRSWRAALLVVPVTLLLASCSDGDGGEASDGDATSGSVDDSEGDGRSDDKGSDESDDEASGEEWIGPLGEFLGWNDDMEMSDEDLRQQRRIEQLTADCMRDEGFEYVPVDPAEAGPMVIDEEGPWSLPPDEFAEQYGYGMSTIDPGDESVVELPAADDPNAKIVDGLSRSAQDAYYKALYGDGKGGTFVMSAGGAMSMSVADVPGKGGDKGKDETSTPGCMTKANDEVYGPGPTRKQQASFDSLQKDMDALWERVENDQRVAAAADAWADCMADAGYPEMIDLEDPWTEVDKRVKEVMGNQYGAQGLSSAGSGPTGGDGGKGGQDPGSDEPDPQALEALRDFERSLATADYECRQPYEEVHRDAQTEIEEAFIEANRTELERYRDVMATNRGGMGSVVVAG